MKKSFITMIALVSVFSLSSCYTQRLVISKNAKIDKDNPTFEESQPFFVRGISQTKTFDAQQACGGKSVAAVDVQYTVVDGLLMSITGSIYAPRTIKVYCN